jgi:hypothetical protein
MTKVDHMKMPELREYVVKYNARLRAFKEPTIELACLSKAEFLRLVRSISCDLSPENLSHDGELSREKVDERGKYLAKCLEQLRGLVET